MLVHNIYLFTKNPSVIDIAAQLSPLSLQQRNANVRCLHLRRRWAPNHSLRTRNITVRYCCSPWAAAGQSSADVRLICRHRRHLHRRLQLRGRNLTMTNGLCEASPLSPPPSLYKLNSLIQTIFNDFKLTSNHWEVITDSIERWPVFGSEKRKTKQK